MNKKWKKIFLLFAYIIVALLIVYLIKPPYLINILIIYCPPTLLNFYWLKNSRGKILLFALLATILFALPIELIARLANAWDVQSLFPRLFGLVPLENILYAFFNFAWPLAFYEYFVDRDEKKKISSKWKYLMTIFIVFSVIVYSIYAYNKAIISLPYWVIGIFGLLIPFLIIYIKNPKLIKKVLLTTLFFGSVFCLHEIVSLYLGHWWWPGEYLFTINLFENVFPLDDVVIWYIFSTPTLIGGYEFFVDDYE